MRILLLERDQAQYLALLQAANAELELCTDTAQAASCPVWLAEPDLAVPLLRQGLRPVWLQSTWAGITPLLAHDLPRDYRLSRAVGIFGQVMAEYVLTYLLAHRRRLLPRLASQVAQQWDNQAPPSLRGCRVLIVGAGAIGSEVARLLVPFGVELRGIAREPRKIAPFAEVHGLQDLPEQAAWADCLVNLLPDTPASRDIYDAALFARMRPEALFINSGRGSAVVETDLVQALIAGQLAGAVIDVCREEPLPAGHPFWEAPRLLLTGHSSAPTEPAAMARLFLDNLQRYRTHQALRGEVNFARGY
ncbi:D-2-hydroxyacid dehydrogenase [Pseudomonas sp. zbq_18]|uniref:D-2-hydroxyacid dehydrogenase n=1 Tax=Pseudomonas sp. zbq_18 TaxID=3367251 RepID=UPI00370AD02E